VVGGTVVDEDAPASSIQVSKKSGGPTVIDGKGSGETAKRSAAVGDGGEQSAAADEDSAALRIQVSPESDCPVVDGRLKSKSGRESTVAVGDGRERTTAAGANARDRREDAKKRLSSPPRLSTQMMGTEPAKGEKWRW
jgi:hypothetical protein